MRYNTASKWSKEKFTIDDDEGKPQFEVVRVYGWMATACHCETSGTTNSL